MKIHLKGATMLYITLCVMSIFIVLFFSMKGTAMSIFSSKEEDVVVFSPMQGKLTYEGKPAAGVKIVRWLIWKDNDGEKETFYTNDKGEFNIPIKTDRVKLSAIATFVMSQTLLVYYNDDEIPIWVKSKRDKTLYGELGGQPVNLHCELTTKRKRIENDDGLFSTSCVWDSIK